MHVVYVTLVDPTGESGQNIYSRSVATALASHPEISLSLICPEPNKPLPEAVAEPTVRTQFLPTKRPRSLTWHLTAQSHLYQALRAVADAKQIDGFVTTLRPSLLAPGLFARVHDVPMALLVEGPLARNVEQFTWVPIARRLTDIVTRWNTATSDCVFTADATSREWIASHAPNDITVTQFGQGVDAELFSPRDQQAARDGIPIKLDSDFVVGFVGSFKPYHCLEPLVEAVAHERLSDITLLLVGDGPRRNSIKCRTRDLGVADRVHCPGFIEHEQVPEYIAACDVLYGVISPNRPESPLKVYEYLACGRPVITLRDEEFAFVDTRDVGVTVDEVSPEAVGDAIQEVRDRPHGERREMGERAQQFIEQERTWYALVEEIIECLDSPES
jgi:glycosyltransferase involved in cell wall biosynthesis